MYLKTTELWQVLQGHKIAMNNSIKMNTVDEMGV